MHSYKIQSENVERLAAEATSSDAALFPWLRTQAHTKADEGYLKNNYVYLLFYFIFNVLD